MRSARLTMALPALSLVLAAAACKPPPTDADLARDVPQAAPTFASDPLPSPETDGAIWAPGARQSSQPSSPRGIGEPARARLIYGVPGQPALVALECLGAGDELPSIRITRLAPADDNASALLALVGNGHIGRLPVDARDIGGRSVWQGEAVAGDIVWEPLAGSRALGLTVPGAGRVELNASDLPGQLIEECRAG